MSTKLVKQLLAHTIFILCTLGFFYFCVWGNFFYPIIEIVNAVATRNFFTLNTSLQLIKFFVVGPFMMFIFYFIILLAKKLL